MPKIIALDSQLVKSVEPILNDVGIDLDTVLKMTLKKIARDKDISFLMAKQPDVPAANTVTPTALVSDDRISKGRAIALFEAQGFRVNRNVTFASKNRSAYNYWANPYFFALDNDWYLILNDWQKKELHLFLISARSIHPDSMVCRIDQKDKIDLQICYNDPTYTDNRSKISFAKYLLKSIRY